MYVYIFKYLFMYLFFGVQYAWLIKMDVENSTFLRIFFPWGFPMVPCFAVSSGMVSIS